MRQILHTFLKKDTKAQRIKMPDPSLQSKEISNQICLPHYTVPCDFPSIKCFIKIPKDII